MYNIYRASRNNFKQQKISIKTYWGVGYRSVVELLPYICKHSRLNLQYSRATPKHIQCYTPVLVTFHISVATVPDRKELKEEKVYFSSWFHRVPSWWWRYGRIYGHGNGKQTNKQRERLEPGKAAFSHSPLMTYFS